LKALATDQEAQAEGAEYCCGDSIQDDFGAQVSSAHRSRAHPEGKCCVESRLYNEVIRNHERILRRAHVRWKYDDQYSGCKQHGLGIQQVYEETLPESTIRKLRAGVDLPARKAVTSN
jgi:hypothetical protein